jgi:hypothetical protein
MPICVVRQPTGKLAVFSTGVDDFVAAGMTETETVACLTRPGLFRHTEDFAREKVRRGVEDAPYDDGPPIRFNRGDGLDRWCDCLATIMAVHGWPRAARRIRDMA